MNTNLDHSIFAKKEQSIALSIKVEEFLQIQNLEEPIQLPFGYSEAAANSKEYGSKYDAQTTMRLIMASSVAEERKKKSGFISKEKTEKLTENNRLSTNRNARIEAFNNGLKEFEGICTRHGLTMHSIKSDGTKHGCKACILIDSRKQTEMRRKSAKIESQEKK